MSSKLALEFALRGTPGPTLAELEIVDRISRLVRVVDGGGLVPLPARLEERVLAGGVLLVDLGRCLADVGGGLLLHPVPLVLRDTLLDLLRPLVLRARLVDLVRVGGGVDGPPLVLLDDRPRLDETSFDILPRA